MVRVRPHARARRRARDRARTSSPRYRTPCYHPPHDFERLVRDRNTSMGDTAATYPRCENTRERPARARKPPSAHDPGVGSMAFPRPSTNFCETLCMRLISFSPLPNIRPRRSGRPRYRPSRVRRLPARRERRTKSSGCTKFRRSWWKAGECRPRGRRGRLESRKCKTVTVTSSWICAAFPVAHRAGAKRT